jgi:catechol 2,3-dioxygenase-like lactoylglutathione lyase family enzyme
MASATGAGIVAALHHVQLAMPVHGEAQARAFYQHLLGIPEVAKPARLASRGGCWFERGALRVHLGVEADFRPARKAHPAFLVSPLSALIARLEAGGHPCRDGGETPRTVHVEDPFGNRIELIEADPAA